MKTISVIGSGTMGNGIAHSFAQAGHTVRLVDISQPSLDKGLQTIASNLDRQAAKGIIVPGEKEHILSRISAFTDMESGVSNAQLVVEAATEELALKLDIFSKLDRFAPAEAILASNTSSISITRIAAATQRPGKVIGMHFMNPVPVMKLVEVISGYATSAQTRQYVMDLAAGLGKTPVEVNDYPGFVANRILMPMINEAIISLFEGVAGVTEIDTVMKLGMAHPMGPLQLADFIGLDVCLAILNVLHQGLGQSKYSPCPLLVNMVMAGKKGVKSGEGFYDYSNGTRDALPAARFLS